MAKYKAEPFYAINLGKEKIVFNYFGEYETDKPKEIEALDALCPKWIKCVEKVEKKQADEIPTGDKPEKKPATKKKK